MVGRKIAAQAGSLLKKACVELGGKDALIVLHDADLERAVNAATFGSFMHQGQICMSVERIIVHQAAAAGANIRPRWLKNCEKSAKTELND